jgi:hypothetical protein
VKGGKSDCFEKAFSSLRKILHLTGSEKSVKCSPLDRSRQDGIAGCASGSLRFLLVLQASLARRKKKALTKRFDSVEYAFLAGRCDKLSGCGAAKRDALPARCRKSSSLSSV